MKKSQLMKIPGAEGLVSFTLSNFPSFLNLAHSRFNSVELFVTNLKKILDQFCLIPSPEIVFRTIFAMVYLLKYDILPSSRVPSPRDTSTLALELS